MVWDKQWLQWQWNERVQDCYIASKELLPIVLAGMVWGSERKGKRVCRYYDEMSVAVQDLREVFQFWYKINQTGLFSIGQSCLPPAPGKPSPSNPEGLHGRKEEVSELLSMGWVAVIASDGGEPVLICGFSVDGGPPPFNIKVPIPLDRE